MTQIKLAPKGDFYCVAMGMISTCNADFSIPLNARVIATVDGDQAECQEMLHRANTQPDLLEALEAAYFQFEHNGDESDADKTVLNQMHAAIAAAKGES